MAINKHIIRPAWPLAGHIDLTWSERTGGRDLRLDLLRGFSALAMVVDHVGALLGAGNSWLYAVTGGNAFFVSAAEAFVFLSGLISGIVYGKIAQREGLRAASLKAWRRAWTLYKLSVVMAFAITLFAAVTQPWWASGFTIGNPVTFVIDVLALRRTVVFADIPLLYTLLMLAAPLGLAALLRGRTWLLLAVSWLLWGAYQLVPGRFMLPWTIANNGVFHPAAWQVLFFTAMAIGYHRERLAKTFAGVAKGPYFLLMGLLFALLVQLFRTDGALLAHIPGLDVTETMKVLFAKDSVGLGRLLASAVVFQFAYLGVTLFWRPVAAALGWMLIPLGQNSLYAYTVHVALAALLWLALPSSGVYNSSSAMLNAAVQMAAVLALWLMIQRRALFGIVPR